MTAAPDRKKKNIYMKIYLMGFLAWHLRIHGFKIENLRKRNGYVIALVRTWVRNFPCERFVYRNDVVRLGSFQGRW